MGSLSMNQKILDYVRARPHVTLATPIGIHSTGGVSSIMGINYDEFAAMSGGFRFREGGKFTAPDDVIIDDLYAREKKLKVGSVLHTMNRDWRVSGIFASGKLARVMIPLTVLQELASANGNVTMIYVKLDNPANTQAVIDAMKQDLPEYPHLRHGRAHQAVLRQQPARAQSLHRRRRLPRRPVRIPRRFPRHVHRRPRTDPRNWHS
jgi:putative ABC transport system permease protein